MAERITVDFLSGAALSLSAGGGAEIRPGLSIVALADAAPVVALDGEYLELAEVPGDVAAEIIAAANKAAAARREAEGAKKWDPSGNPFVKFGGD